ncbi:MAG TPA: YncE family protein [Acidobacteriaceae bacterium]
MRSITWLTAGVLAAAACTTGCGNKYRPVINPVAPTGPAQVSTSYALVLSQPELAGASSSTDPCPGHAYASPGVATIIDFSGDSVLAQSAIGNGPLTSAIDASGNVAYALNCDGTITTIPIGANLQNNQLATTTLFPADNSSGRASIQSNILVRSGSPYVVNQVRGTVGALTTASTGNIALFQEINVAPALVTLTGSAGLVGTSATSSAQRVYAISQGTTGSGAKWGDCNQPSAVTVAGEADGIETTTNSVSSRLPLGVCPVYGVTSLDGLRTFVMNRGSGTVSVINTQTNTLDTALNASGTIQLPAGNGGSAGPVYAAFFPQSQMVVTANYDANTVSFINAPVDVYGNDAPGFGQVLATVAVGSHPSALTLLGDGSRVYVANQGDGTISVISMTSFTVQKTIAVGNHPRTISSTYNNPAGRVYVTAPDSNVLTVIRTDTDVVSALITLQGFGVDVHATTQYSGASGITTNTPANTIVTSDAPGSGAP